MMETICDKMEDYAKARYKTNGKLTVVKMMDESGGMNPEITKVDFVQDEDLNKSLKHYVRSYIFGSFLYLRVSFSFFQKSKTEI